MKFGIALKLGLLLAGVSILASGMTGFYAYQASRNMLVQSAKDELLTTTLVLARRVTLSRDEISRNLQVLTSSPMALNALRSTASGQEDPLAALFESIMQANPTYFQIRLISASDNGLERVRIDRADDRLIRVRGDDLQEKGHFSYVSGALKLPPGSTYLSRIVINHERGAHAGLDQPSVILAMPVAGADGKAVGAVVINVDLNNVFATLAADLPKDFQLFLANGKGDYLIHPDASQTFGFDRGRRVLVQDEFAATRDLVSGRSQQALVEVNDGRYSEAPVVAAFVSRTAQVPGDEDKFVLGLAQPLSHVLAQANKLGAVVLQLVLALCLLGIFIATLVARAVTQPINSMSVAVQNFALDHSLAAVPAVERQDEIGVLARSFKQMQDEIHQQLEALQQSREELEHMARHDVLTGLPNRRAFQERLEHALSRAQRSGEHFALFFIDVDNFKSINDRFGHQGGDAVLKIVALRLVATTRKADAIARLGGDEFVVLLDNTANREDVILIAEKLLESVRSPILHRGTELQVGFSIGISLYPDDGRTASELMARADRAMYEAKDAGRNGFRFSNGKTQPTSPTPL
ncbi:GGDEF domain-containing protein [Rhodoferax sp. AJA081-3]|uniref:GGDEF domain-containing protein n=1 Tax=Rhodoferax sp. AJA081-3 TaxID=2752316 RepID=UPI001AE0C541|nr:GGDEF domain-containing protein [Rhodoferax sp. AJA081-3]QTN28546.1 GGDEF domain-containing protein [Rhodoferax sp. AJA081-3]